MIEIQFKSEGFTEIGKRVRDSPLEEGLDEKMLRMFVVRRRLRGFPPPLRSCKRSISLLLRQAERWILRGLRFLVTYGQLPCSPWFEPVYESRFGNVSFRYNYWNFLEYFMGFLIGFSLFLVVFVQAEFDDPFADKILVSSFARSILVPR